jgi:hypothetical protein
VELSLRHSKWGGRCCAPDCFCSRRSQAIYSGTPLTDLKVIEL